MGMTETDKLLVRIGTARDAISRKTEQTSLDYMIDGVLMNCSVMLKEQEEVVRCKDCKHWKLTSCPVTEHKLGYMPPDWFCADGERQEGR